MKPSEVLKKYGPGVGLRYNPTQGEYADFVAEGILASRAADSKIHNGGQLFAEAETGSGKTIGYLLAAGMDCVENGCRAVVATHTLALQRQIIEFDDNGGLSPQCDMARALSMIQAATGRQLSAALRIGKRNFVDDVRATVVIDRLLAPRGGKEINEITRRDLEMLKVWAKANPGGEIRQFLEENGLDMLPARLTFDDICVDDDTGRQSDAWNAYIAHAVGALNADIVVTNHALLVRQALSRTVPILIGDPSGRSLGALIVDECDRIESVARDATSDLVPMTRVRSALAKWSEAHPDGRADAAVTAMNALYASMTALRMDLLPDEPEGQESVVFWDDIPDDKRAALLEMATSLEKALMPLSASPPAEDSAEQATVRAYADEIHSFLSSARRMEKCLTGDGADERKRLPSIAALRWSPDRHYPSFRNFLVRPARVLKSMWAAWTQAQDSQDKKPDALDLDIEVLSDGADARDSRKAHALILTSATISAPTANGKPDVTQMSEVFGIWHEKNACDVLNREGKSFSPRRFGSVQFVCSDPAGPDVYLYDEKVPDDGADVEDGERLLQINPKWVEYMVTITRQAMRQGGRILVLCNSYRATAEIAEGLRRAGMDPIEKTPEIMQASCTRRLVAQPNGIFVTPGAWEGFDISRFTGPDGKPAKIRHVVMTQLPFSKPDGVYNIALQRYLVSRGMSDSSAQGKVFADALAMAKRKVRQGFGRGIRGVEDHFTFWIGDLRFPRPASSALAGLPVRAAAYQQATFVNIIPKRFRVGTAGQDSAWDRARVLLVNGTFVDLGETALA